MKASVKISNLARALGVVSRLVGNAATLPVLANVLITTDKNRLKLSSTNLEMGANYWVGAKVTAEGAITVPARLLADLVANLGEGNLELETEKGNLKVKAEHHQTTLNGISVEEFPSIPEVKGTNGVSIPTADFKTAVSQVGLVASADDARPVLNGVYVYNEGSNLVMVATDSYRLAEKILTLKTAPKTKISVIVPARTMQEVLKAVSEGTEAVEMLVDEGQVLFKFGEGEIVSRQIEGEFPNYRELIPKDESTRVVVEVTQFSSLTKIAGLFTQASAGGVNIEVDTQQQIMKLSSVASQVGENLSEAAVEAKGADGQVTLNSRYISDALGVVGTNKINFSITGKVNPCIIRPVGSKDYLHIIMPLRS